MASITVSSRGKLNPSPIYWPMAAETTLSVGGTALVWVRSSSFYLALLPPCSGFLDVALFVVIGAGRPGADLHDLLAAVPAADGYNFIST